MNAQARLNDLAARDAKNREFAQSYSRESYTLKDLLYKCRPRDEGVEREVEQSQRSSYTFEQAVHWREKKLREAGDNATKRHYEKLLANNILNEVLDLTQIVFPLIELLSVACHFVLPKPRTRHPSHARTPSVDVLWVSLLFLLSLDVDQNEHPYLVGRSHHQRRPPWRCPLVQHDSRDRKLWEYMIWAFGALSAYRIARISSDVLLTGTPGSRTVNAYLERTGDASA